MTNISEKIEDWIINYTDEAADLIKVIVDNLSIDELNEFNGLTERDMLKIVHLKAMETGNIDIDMLLQMTPNDSIASMFCHSNNDLKNHDDDIMYILDKDYFLAKTDAEVLESICIDATYISDIIIDHADDIFELLPEDCELYHILYDTCYKEPEPDYEED